MSSPPSALMATPRPSGSPAGPSRDRLVRLQIFLAFVVPIVLVGVWLSSRGFFNAP
jgi:hypothetical protein